MVFAHLLTEDGTLGWVPRLIKVLMLAGACCGSTVQLGAALHGLGAHFPLIVMLTRSSTPTLCFGNSGNCVLKTSGSRIIRIALSVFTSLEICACDCILQGPQPCTLFLQHLPVQCAISWDLKLTLSCLLVILRQCFYYCKMVDFWAFCD